MSRYAEAHRLDKIAGPGDARPTALQIVEDEGLTGKLTDKVFLVTGVSSGIGVETLRALYATGGHVFGTVRKKCFAFGMCFCINGQTIKQIGNQLYRLYFSLMKLFRVRHAVSGHQLLVAQFTAT